MGHEEFAMNRKASLSAAFVAAFLFFLQCAPSHAFLYLESADSNAILQAKSSNRMSKNQQQLVQSLERITGLELEVRDHFVRLKESQPLPLLYASTGIEVLSVQEADYDRR